MYNRLIIPILDHQKYRKSVNVGFHFELETKDPEEGGGGTSLPTDLLPVVK